MRLKLLLFFIYTPSFLFGQDLVEKDIYVFSWGTLSDTIIDVNEIYHSIRIQTDFSTLKKVIDNPIFIMKNGERIEIESFGLSVYNRRRADLTQAFQVDKYNPRKSAKSHGNEKIGHLLTDFTQLHFFNVKAKNDFTFNASIQFEKQNKGYVSHVKLPDIPKGETYDFQVISFENQKTILRVDTTNESTKHIQKIYANPSKYQIIHIPDFKTTRRYVSEVDLLDVKTESISLIENDELVSLSFLEVPEFTDYSIEKIPFILQWGELQNLKYEIFRETEIIKTENAFSPDDIIENSTRLLFLNLGYQDFEIVKMRVSIVPESGIPYSFVTDHLNYSIIQKEIENISSSTTILFDQLFIKSKNDKIIFLPPAFRFLIE